MRRIRGLLRNGGVRRRRRRRDRVGRCRARRGDGGPVRGFESAVRRQPGTPAAGVPAGGGGGGAAVPGGGPAASGAPSPAAGAPGVFCVYQAGGV
ncbi:hypothetical protein BEN35_25865 [Streptomyces fradiae]|nr:hypothetical protein BEN35_25865 [Streptomyces fradiae]